MKNRMVKITLVFCLISTVPIVFQSCTTSSNTNNTISDISAISIVKKLLINASNEGFNVLSNPDSFISNDIINDAMPVGLKDINSKLENLGLQNIVQKEKEYLAKAGLVVVGIAKPIVNSAIQEITMQDAIKILSGGKGAATDYLMSKVESKLSEKIKPEINNQLNTAGLSGILDKAIVASNLLGIIKGDAAKDISVNGISEYASEQIINGLFGIMKNYENNNLTPTNVIDKIMKIRN